MSDQEIARLREVLAEGHGAATERDRVLVELLLATGMRLASALAVDVEDVDLERREILLRTTKGDAPQRVVLGAASAGVLERFIGAGQTGPVFMNGRSLRLDARHAQAGIAGWMRRARIARASAHSLRHTFAAALYRRSRDVLVVRAALGHRSIASTAVYAAASADDVRRCL